jgi:2,4-diketo-3-deoxy-L-fuconate hydrolase
MTGLHEGTFALGRMRRGSGPPFLGLVLDDGRVARVAADLPGLDSLEMHAIDQLDVLAPVQPTHVVQAGANYYQHVLDLIVSEARGRGLSEDDARGEGTRIMDARVATGEPYLFLGAVGAICGPYDDVVLPADGEQHDWELELGIVLHNPRRRVPEAEATDLVAGYTIVNDLTTRDRLYRPDLKAIGTDWVTSKNAPTFLPTGPFLVPRRFVEDPTDLRITLRHNGDVMQDESTADMIFSAERLIAYAAQRLPLRDGDLLATGSPAGNGAHWGRFLADGDVLDGQITGLGRQRNVCRPEEV